MGKSVILDGNFGDPVRRAGVWKLAREFDPRVIAIRTACDAPDLIRERARRRAADPTAADHGVSYAAHVTTLAEVLANPPRARPGMLGAGRRGHRVPHGQGPPASPASLTFTPMCC